MEDLMKNRCNFMNKLYKDVINSIVSEVFCQNESKSSNKNISDALEGSSMAFEETEENQHEISFSKDEEGVYMFMNPVIGDSDAIEQLKVSQEDLSYNKPPPLRKKLDT